MSTTTYDPPTAVPRFRPAYGTLLLLAALLLAACTGIVIPPAPEAPSAAAETMPPATADTVRARELTDEGLRLFGLSQFAEAEQIYQEALVADPAFVPALANLSDLYSYQPQKWRQALALAEAAYALAPEDGTVLAHLAWAQQLAHRFDDAWRSAEKAVAADPDNYLAQAAYADILLSVYETEQARVHAEKAVALNPEAGLTWVVLGNVQEAMHDWVAAEESVLKAVELEPEFLLWNLVQGRLDFDMRGDTELTRELAARVTTGMPDHPYVIGLEVDLAIEDNDWETATAGCQRLTTFHTEDTPYPDGYTCLATVALLQEDREASDRHQREAEAVAWADRFDISLVRMRLLNDADKCAESRALAQKWLDARPYSIAAHRMMGVGFLCSEDFDQAIEFLSIAADKMPYSVADARLLAIAYARNEMKSEATSTLARVRQFAFDDPLYYQALYELHFILGDLDSAIENAQRWAVFRPGSTDALESIAFAQVYNGDAEAAFRSAQNAYDRGSTTSTTLGILGYVNLLYGEFETAEDLLLRAVEKDADFYLARFSLFQMYQVSDRCEDSEPHVNWLKSKADSSEEIARFEAGLAACYERRTAQETREEGQVTLQQVETQVTEKLAENNMDLRFFKVLERAGQRALVVYYASQEDPTSTEYRREEIGAGFLLASLLPLIESRPDSLILVSGTAEERIAMVVIDTATAALWLNDQLEDEQFVSTWRREDAANMPADIFADIE